MAKRWIKLCTSETFSSPTEFTHDSKKYTVSDINNIKKILLALVEEGNASALKKALLDYYIYPSKGETSTEQYKGNWHTRTWELQTFIAQPVIEAIYLEHPKLFKILVDAIILKKDKNLETAFIECCLAENDLPTTMFDSFTEEQKIQLDVEFKALRDKDSTNKDAQSLANQLTQFMSKMPKGNGLKQLHYKLQFIELLHSQDRQLSKEINYRKILVNIATLILSAGLLNLVNLAATGNFLFFSQTKALTKISDIDALIGKDKLHPTPPNIELANDDSSLKHGDQIKPAYHHEPNCNAVILIATYNF